MANHHYLEVSTLLNETWGSGLMLIRTLQEYRTPVLDDAVYGLTFLGDPMILLLLAAVITLAINRGVGIKMGLALLAAVITYSALKVLVGDPRPYFLDPEVGVVSATGFGFPSGHAMVAVVFWVGLVLWMNTARRFAAWAIGLSVIAVVGMSRVYLGVHFPMDVIGGLVVGAGVLTLVGQISSMGSRYGWPHASNSRSDSRLVLMGAVLVSMVSILLAGDLKTAIVLGLLAGTSIGLVTAKVGGDPGFSYLMDGMSILKRASTGMVVLVVLGGVAITGALVGGVIEALVPTLAGVGAGIWLTDLSPRAFIAMGLARLEGPTRS